MLSKPVVEVLNSSKVGISGATVQICRQPSGDWWKGVEVQDCFCLCGENTEMGLVEHLAPDLMAVARLLAERLSLLVAQHGPYVDRSQN